MAEDARGSVTMGSGVCVSRVSSPSVPTSLLLNSSSTLSSTVHVISEAMSCAHSLYAAVLLRIYLIHHQYYHRYLDLTLLLRVASDSYSITHLGPRHAPCQRCINDDACNATQVDGAWHD